MANTVHGPFVKGGSTTGVYTGGGAYTSGNANNGETQSAVALASFNPDLLTAPVVLSGVACVKDATTASQLNITSGEAYLQVSDGTIARIDVAATSQSASGHPSTTMYLYLQPDGTWYWNTANSPAANSLAICQVTTDGSSNISGVTDKRVMVAAALGGLAHTSTGQPGGLALPAPLKSTLTQTASLAAGVFNGVTFGQVGALRGSMDGAALFNGTNGFISAPIFGLPTSANAPLSLECWFYQTAAPGNTQIALALGNPGVNGAEFYIAFASATAPWAGNGTTNSNSAPVTTTNTWHHVVATFDGSNIRVYCDGALVSGPTAASITLAYGGLAIGQLGNGTDWFAGQIDEVAVYTTALSGTRVSAHYNAGISATSDAYAATVLADAPARYYRLGDAVGATSAVCTQSATVTQVVDAGGNLSVPGAANITGALTSLGGQATTGSFGAPVIVAQTVDQHITATTATTLLTFTAPAAGLYRASLYVLAGGSGNPSTLTAKAIFTDRNGFAQTNFFSIQTLTAGGVNPATLNSASVAMANCIAAYPIMGYVKSGGTCQIVYQNATATPNDYASAMIERLS